MTGPSRTSLKTKHLRCLAAISAACLMLGLVACHVAQTLAANPPQESTQPISSRLAFLRAQRAAAAQRQPQPNQQGAKNETASSSPNVSKPTEVAPVRSSSGDSPAPAASQPQHSAAVASKAGQVAQNDKPQQPQQAQAPATNRTTRTADVFHNGDGFNIFVTNTCERELMRVNIKTSRPFFGVIHTRNQRQKAGCTVEGTGETEYNLDISHVLNQQDPAYCGVIKARKESPDDKDLLSVVLAVRVHRNIELSDDKFFLLNCTNRCRRPDCSTPLAGRAGSGADDEAPNARIINEDLSIEREGGEREGSGARAPTTPADRKNGAEDECTVWKFPWLITLLWCMAILLLAMIISHCIMCSSLVCRCVKTEVEEREPSVYEGATDLDDEDSLYNRKTHPLRIDYDNRDIYKTSNNYEPYSLNERDDDHHHHYQEKRDRSNKRKSNSRSARR